MKITLFTVAEANRAVAEIQPVLEQMVRAWRELDALRNRVEALMLALSGAAAANPDRGELRDLVSRRQAIADRLRAGVEAIQKRGAVVKDLSHGLVDFYSVAGDRLVFLCWRLGEPKVAHWHPLEGGFAARQPLKPTGSP